MFGELFNENYMRYALCILYYICFSYTSYTNFLLQLKYVYLNDYTDCKTSVR